MKKILLSLTFKALLAGIAFTSCKPATKEVNESQEKVEEAQENLIVAKKVASAEEWKAFKNNIDSIIIENENQINLLKAKIKKSRIKIDNDYEQKINELEQKNKNLKAKIKAYKNDPNNDWEEFKREFNHDKDELGHALKDLTINNTK